MKMRRMMIPAMIGLGALSATGFAPLDLWPVTLVCFALLLTRVEASYAGRAYAAYGGIYVAASLFWLAFVEKSRPLWSDWVGVALCIAGASVVLLGPKLAP